MKTKKIKGFVHYTKEHAKEKRPNLHYNDQKDIDRAELAANLEGGNYFWNGEPVSQTNRQARDKEVEELWGVLTILANHLG